MEFLSAIRSWALRDKMPIRATARRTDLSRNTVKKYLHKGPIVPNFKTPPRPSKLDSCADRLSAWLLAQIRKSHKERHTVKLMYEELVKLGYDGSYESVAALARAWRDNRHGAERTTGHGTCVSLVFQPGKAFRFDWRRLLHQLFGPSVFGLLRFVMLCKSPFEHHRFPREIILCAVRWHLRYPLSYQDAIGLMAERGVTMD